MKYKKYYSEHGVQNKNYSDAPVTKNATQAAKQICDVMDLMKYQYVWYKASDDKWITYNNNIWKRLWLKENKASQMVAKSGLTTLSVCGEIIKELFTMSYYSIEIKQPEWINSEVTIHPSYSPDIAPLEYHLFQSLQNSLNSVKLAAKEACENHLIKFFIQKNIENLQ
ncbi:histone-lysine N-methyltransferase SETMAR-like [Vespula maculifrons]|uniref:Histone-lysine N-methyltransferase SETMAR-like n=1 Tax=Vespula maculifrons TaxID=7453 RepID=A0ABD2AZV2_VESMC